LCLRLFLSIKETFLNFHFLVKIIPKPLHFWMIINNKKINNKKHRNALRRYRIDVIETHFGIKLETQLKENRFS
jgi:hypothetical protein